MQADIQDLIETLPELRAAAKSGSGHLYSQMGEKYAEIAHRVFESLTENSKGFFDDDYRPIYLDAWVVRGRTESLISAGEEDVTPLNIEFWRHGDAIKALAEYLQMMEQDGKVPCVPCA